MAWHGMAGCTCWAVAHMPMPMPMPRSTAPACSPSADWYGLLHVMRAQEDDVRKYVVAYQKERTDKNGKKHTKAPKIQR